jgi:hypothetical protein
MCLAEQQSAADGLISPYDYLSHARNKLGLDKNDPNLSAAERYYEAYENGAPAIFIEGQHLLKITREINIPGTSVKPIEMLFGKNGSSAEDSAFIRNWGMYGIMHKDAGHPAGGQRAGVCAIYTREILRHCLP